jgi:hypothetical protein
MRSHDAILHKQYIENSAWGKVDENTFPHQGGVSRLAGPHIVIFDLFCLSNKIFITKWRCKNTN